MRFGGAENCSPAIEQKKWRVPIPAASTISPRIDWFQRMTEGTEETVVACS
jgi:hypothetical protein